MGFFRRREDEDGEQAQSLARVAEGGIPPRAEARLKALGTEGSLFTSGLSVNEFALLHRLGPRPLAQVMGASVVRTGWQFLPALDPGMIVLPSAGYVPGSSLGPALTGRALQNPFTEPSFAQIRSYKWHTEVVCELDVLTEAWNLARRRAVDRLREEAVQVGADAVVGVHLRRSDHDLGTGMIEYVVTGTAVRLPDGAGTSSPILTDVSGQDFWRLVQAGQEAVGLLAATVVVFASPPRSTRTRRLRTMAQNQELTEISDAFRAARETVRARLHGQVASARGAGAVGVELAHSVRHEKLAVASSLQSTSLRGWHRGRLGLPYFVSGRGEFERRGWVITMHGAGTAVRPRQAPAHPPVKTTLRMGSAP